MNSRSLRRTNGSTRNPRHIDLDIKLISLRKQTNVTVFYFAHFCSIKQSTSMMLCECDKGTGSLLLTNGMEWEMVLSSSSWRIIYCCHSFVFICFDSKMNPHPPSHLTSEFGWDRSWYRYIFLPESTRSISHDVSSNGSLARAGKI